MVERSCEDEEARSGRRKSFAAVSQNARHPNQFLQEFIDTANVIFIKQLAAFVEQLSHAAEIHVFKNRDETKFTHHRQQIFNHARAAEWPRRNAADSDRLVNVFFQIHIKRVFEKAGIPVIIFRDNQNQTVRALHDLGEDRIFHLLACVVQLHRQITNVDQFSFDAFAFFDFREYELRYALALPTLAHSAENHWNKKPFRFLIHLVNSLF